MYIWSNLVRVHRTNEMKGKCECDLNQSKGITFYNDFRITTFTTLASFYHDYCHDRHANGENDEKAKFSFEYSNNNRNG